MKFRHNRI